MKKQSKFRCPCCGYPTLNAAPPGTYDICSICFWEDDRVQYNDPDYPGGANRLSLRAAQRNVRDLGVSDPQKLERRCRIYAAWRASLETAACENLKRSLTDAERQTIQTASVLIPHMDPPIDFDFHTLVAVAAVLDHAGAAGLPPVWCDFSASGWSGDPNDPCYYILDRVQLMQYNPHNGMELFVFDYDNDVESGIMGCKAALEPYQTIWRARPQQQPIYRGTLPVPFPKQY